MAMTFEEKYERARPSFIKVNEKRFADLEAGTTVLIPSPQDIEREVELALGELDAGVPAGDVPPVWQVISPDSPLASKLPGGPVRIAQLRDPQV